MTTPAQKRMVIRLLSEGFSYRETAKKAGVSLSTVQRWMNQTKGVPTSTVGKERTEAKRIEELPGPIPFAELRPEAARALEDFTYFQRRYFGRVATPWQAEAAERIAAALDTPDEEYFVINAPPGSGKTTVFTHDIPIWLTCRDRSLRGLIGSANQRAAQTLSLIHL